MTVETQLRLAEVDNIIGVKEASGAFVQIANIIEGASDRYRVWSGSDEDTLPILATGGYGVISVISHLVGRQLKQMIEDAVAGRTKEAARTHRALLPLIDALFLLSNPVPLKYAMAQLGVPVGGLRLPLCEPDAATAERIMAEVRRHRIDLPVAV
jgi:4-hydroxy-tetrahydrodipicolinate synthase